MVTPSLPGYRRHETHDHWEPTKRRLVRHPSGHRIRPGAGLTLVAFQLCGPSLMQGPKLAGSCLARYGIHSSLVYQPAARFWPFQFIETGIYVGRVGAAAHACDRLDSPPGELMPDDHLPRNH